jgi:hypothetical protein
MKLSTKQNLIAENMAYMGLAISNLKKMHTTALDEDYGISTDQVLNMVSRAEQMTRFMGECFDTPVNEK